MLCLMRLINKFKYLYAFILILFTLLYAFLKPEPKLNYLLIEAASKELFDQNLKNITYRINPPNNRVSLGESFFIKDNENWYQIIQLSFWRKEFLNLDFLNSQLNINDINVKSISSNNYALGRIQGEEIVYSCMKNSNNFNYWISSGKVVDSFDINHWKKVYIDNLNLVFYSFKPRNYECYVVITTNLNFFENSGFDINKKIFNKFIYE